MKRATALIVGMVAVLSLPLAAGRPAASQGGVAISVGSVSLKPKEEMEKFQPFADFLASRLRGAGVVRGRAVVAPSMTRMADLIRRGEVDLYIDSPFPVIRVSALSGAKPFLRRWKKGVAEYHSVLFVRKDGDIEQVRDLRGKMVAFENDYSTSGFLLPKGLLMKAGLAVAELVDENALVPPDRVGYVFSYDDENTMLWVLRRKVAAGATDADNMKELAAGRIGDLKIVLRSPGVPRHVVAHRPTMPPALVAAVEEALMGLERDAEGRAALKKFQSTARFDRFPQGPEEALRPVRDLMGFVGAGLK
ncbi:MAG: phosphate/phosphite/phosphonate ABC transporter substrate-binding protein [Armatimonadetes bacterium]|nr:phosphate/phosphite/phosphonate ABC transporter substrate-binding protein [Armatimonadota bacterium]